LPLFGPPNVDRFKARGDVLELIKALDYPKHWRVRRDAAEALGEIGDPDAVEPLIGVLRDDNPSVRMSAAEALGQIGDVRAVEPLIAARKEASWSVRRAAAEALGRIGDPDATDALTAALEDHDSNVRRAATESLEAIASQPLRPRSGIPAGRAAPLVRAQRTRRLR
jgi:HEAT repeat protein